MKNLHLSLENGIFHFEADSIHRNELWIYPSNQHQYVVNLHLPFAQKWSTDGMPVEVRYAISGQGRKFIPHKTYQIGIQKKDILTLKSFTEWLEELIPTLRFNEYEYNI
jgi:hypothetical protein